MTKDAYDISKVFLTYLAFLGNASKVGIALAMQPEEVEVLAAKEDWAHKLKVYMALRHNDPISETDREINRAVLYVQACHLRELIDRVLSYLGSKDTEEMLALMSPKNVRTAEPKLCPQPLIDLIRATQTAHALTNRALGDKPGKADEEAEEQRRLAMAEAICRAMSAADNIPGLDSVGIARDCLQKWDNTPGQHTTEEGA